MTVVLRLTHSLLSFPGGTPISSKVFGPLPGGLAEAELAGTAAGFDCGAPAMGAVESGLVGAILTGLTFEGTCTLFAGGRLLGAGRPGSGRSVAERPCWLG
jgi:hypothetical protein